MRTAALRDVHRAGDGAAALLARTLRAAALAAVAVAGAVAFLIGAAVVDASALGLDRLDAWMAEADGGSRYVSVAFGGLAVGVVALAIAMRGRHAPTGALHIITTSPTGIVVIGSDSVSTVIAAAARGCPGVVDAGVTVRGPAAGPVRLAVDASAVAGTELPMLGRSVQDAARHAAEHFVGLKVQDVNVRINVAPDDALRRLVE